MIPALNPFEVQRPIEPVDIGADKNDVFDLLSAPARHRMFPRKPCQRAGIEKMFTRSAATLLAKID